MLWLFLSGWHPGTVCKKSIDDLSSILNVPFLDVDVISVSGFGREERQLQAFKLNIRPIILFSKAPVQMVSYLRLHKFSEHLPELPDVCLLIPIDAWAYYMVD